MTLEILYEDNKLVVCVKPVGVLSQPDTSKEGDNMLSLLQKQITPLRGEAPWVGLVHRLDRGAGGVMVFGKRQDSTAALCKQVADRTLRKEYLAVVHGCPAEPVGTWKDYICRDAGKGTSYIVSHPRKDAKEAVLSYRVLQTAGVGEEARSLLQIVLLTGRTHQIRAQFSHRNMPLVGDGKYGARDRGEALGLWSYRLTFRSPEKRGGIKTFHAAPPADHTAFSPFAALLTEELPTPD